MSDLHRILRDPSQPLESTLSILFNAGDAGDTFQREIFSYLNMWDARNLRLANRRLDQIVRGVPVWQTRDKKGKLTYTRDRPANPTNPTVYNSTLVWLGARCNGARFPGLIPCQTGPQTNIEVRYCTRIPPPLNANPPRGRPCCDEICTLCVINAANQWTASETLTIRRNREMKLCGQCQLYEARRHPYGYSGCNCRSLLRDGWMCWSCRHETFKQISNNGSRKRRLIEHLHRDRQGRKVSDLNRPRASTQLCPGCARYFRNRDPQVCHVTYCMSCDEVVVKPSLGPDYRPTRLMPVQPVRWSKRIAEKYATMPPLDFTPIIVPRP